MNRREAINRVAWILGGTVIGANLFLEGCTRPATNSGVQSLFDTSNIDLMGDIADTILPTTSSPGAKEAGVGSFFPVYVRDCYTEQDQDSFVKCMSDVDERSQQEYGKRFQQLAAEERTQLINTIDKEAKEYQHSKTADQPNHPFHLFKQLTLLGFFSSELGATKALRYVQIPGKYDGDYPYKKGDKAWAT